MRRTLPLCFLLLAGLAFCAPPEPARAQNRSAAANISGVRRDLQTQYARFIRAYMTRDTQAARDILTPDFRGGRPGRRGGSVNREEVIQALQQAFGGVGLVRRSSLRIERLRLQNNGRTALATTRHEFVGTVTDPRSGKGRSLDARLRYRDTWVRTGDGWKLRRSVPLLQRVLVDGKPMGSSDRSRRSAARARAAAGARQ